MNHQQNLLLTPTQRLIFKKNVDNYSLEYNLLQAYITCGENTLYRVKVVTDLSWKISKKIYFFNFSMLNL